jgi:ferredoxin
MRKSWLRHVPDMKRHRGFPPPWRQVIGDVPDRLRTVPGVWRDADLEREAYEEGPQFSFLALHGAQANSIFRRWGWSYWLPSLPRLHRSGESMRQILASQPPDTPPIADSQALTDELRQAAEQLGLSAVGFAPYDPKYTFAEALHPTKGADTPLLLGRDGPPDQGSVVVCLLEQDWEKTQQIPSGKSEREVMRTYEGVVERAAGLARLLQRKGFRADVAGPGGPAVSIHYAVEAGLGQLGLNGQLLTPQAGSRCRITLITTNATLAHDKPVDYGMQAICDECRLCVRRCPPGAIPNKRSYHRGVLKAKIKPERCFPILIQAHGCGICQKVCPIQRYGLGPVKNHLLETGQILGKGSDELEGYRWIDGRHYGPGQKPRITRELLHPDGLHVDPERKVPVAFAPADAVDPAEAMTMM